MALEFEGAVVAVGNIYGGQCNVADWMDIVQVAVGETHAPGLKCDGTVVVAGPGIEPAKWGLIRQCPSMSSASPVLMGGQ